jgi:predicted permease
MTVPSPLGMLRELWYRLTAGGRRASLDRQLDEELRFHEEQLARDFEHGGLTAADAHAAAQRKIGNTLSIRERSAEWWGFPSVETVAQDVRYGARMLRRSPAFTLIAVGAIGLAIGINAGFFTLIDVAMWQPMPVANPGRLVKLLAVDGSGGTNIRFAYPEYITLSTSSKTIQDLVAFDAEPVALRVPSNGTLAEAASAGCVSGNYFAALGGVPTVGRALSPADDRPGAPPAIVINDQLWQRAFARSRDVVGRDVVINGAHVTIVGVMQPTFIGVVPLVPDLWMPLTVAEAVGATPGRLSSLTNRFIVLRGRVRTTATMAQAAAELSTLLREPPAAPGTRADLTRRAGVALMPNSSPVPLTNETAMVAAPGMFLVALVLVIACANLANLLLSRALVRQREIAVRLALGASRRRLLRQLLTESLLIAVMGASLGLLLGHWTVTVVSRSLFANFPTTLGTVALVFHPSWRVFAYTVLLALLSVLTFGLAPALQATAPNLTSALKGEDTLFGTRIRRSRFRDGLVAVQVAACVVLLAAVGIFVQSLRAFGNTDTGLDTDRVTVATLGLAGIGHVPPELAAARIQFAARVAARPGVARTARAAQSPFTPWPALHVAAAGDRGPLRTLPYNVVTPQYFDVVGQRLVAGRGFAIDDSSASVHVAIVTATAARTLWPTASAVGQSLRVGSIENAPDVIYQIVGVVSDAHSGMVWDWDGAGYVFLPASTTDLSTRDMPLLVRMDAPVSSLARVLPDLARDADPNAPLHVSTVPNDFAFQLVPFRYAAFVASGVGAVGLVLAVVGLYGVVAFAVTQRRRDIAVHIAMGARPRDVLRLLLQREMRLVLAGLAAGLVIVVAESRVLGSVVIPLAPLGGSGLAVLAITLLLVAVGATIVPGLAALRIAPIQVLRQE